MNGTTKSGRSIRNVIYLEGGSGESGDSDQDEKLSKKSPRNRKKEIEILSDPESDAKQKDNTEKKNDLNKVRLTRARASDEKRDKHKRRLKSDSESDLSINSKTKKKNLKEERVRNNSESEMEMEVDNSKLEAKDEFYSIKSKKKEYALKECRVTIIKLNQGVLEKIQKNGFVNSQEVSQGIDNPSPVLIRIRKDILVSNSDSEVDVAPKIKKNKNKKRLRYTSTQSDSDDKSLAKKKIKKS